MFINVVNVVIHGNRIINEQTNAQIVVKWVA